MIDHDHSPLAPQDSASNLSTRLSPEPVVHSTLTNIKKRKHTEVEHQFAPKDRQLTDDWQAYTEPQKDHAQTEGTSKPFIPPNLSLARSIDHSKTNPSNDIRLKTPYPAPADILSASHKRYLSNIAIANAKAAAGASDSSNRIPFTIYEDDKIIAHMLAVSKDTSVPRTEERFAEVSRRLCGGGGAVFRSGTAIKNMWCRVGRGRSGFDERKGVRRNTTHVVNGWRAKPGNEKKRTSTKKRKVTAAAAATEVEDDGWFEL